MINVCANWGSTGRIAEQIGVLAQKNGWDVYMAFGGSHNPSQLKTIKIGNKALRFLHYILYRFFDREGMGSIIATWLFSRKIKKIKPDVVHLHNIHGHYLNYTILFKALKEMRVPVVWTLHDNWPITGHCYLYRKNDCNKWKTECDNCIKNGRYAFDNSKANFIRKKEAFTSLDCITLITVSRWLAGVVKESFLKKYPLKTIYNGIDLNVFRPHNTDEIRKRFQLFGQTIILGVASTWTEGKGYSDYISLSRLLPDDYKIVMIGLTKKQITKLPNNILGIERTQNVAELVEWYSIADVVLSLSYGESMGLTPIEGMACGTPAVVYDNTAQPELVTSETGIIVETGNVGAVRDAIIKLCSMPKSDYIEKCTKRASVFEKEKQFHEYISEYEYILSKC